MLLAYRLEMKFQRAHVQDPVISEMARRFSDVMFNIESISVGNQDASLVILLVGEPAALHAAHDYFTSIGAETRVLSEAPYEGKIPATPMRPSSKSADERLVEKKLWLIVLGSPRRSAFLWEMSRRFDVTFKLMQSVSGETVSILSMLVWGPKTEVDKAVLFLREREINVEFGEIALSAPFTPIG